MKKTRELFKKIRDTKGIFYAKMGSIKDRNGLDLTEAKDIKKRWQEYTEELYKKDLHDPGDLLTYKGRFFTIWTTREVLYFVKHFPFPICVVEICDLGSDCSHFIFQNQVSKPIVHKYDMLSFTNVLKPRISFCSFARMREKGNENEFCVYPFSV